MKRKILFATGLIILALFTLNSCKKEDPTSLVLDTSKTATISGTVYAELDYSTNGMEKAPLGTAIFFKVSNSEYIGGADGVTIHETTVGSGGSYSITIPVTDEGVNIIIEAEDFKYYVVQYDGTTVSTTFLGGEMHGVTDAITNSNYIRDFSY